MGLLPNLVVARPHIAAADFAGIIADANGSGFKRGGSCFWLESAMCFPSTIPNVHPYLTSMISFQKTL